MPRTAELVDADARLEDFCRRHAGPVRQALCLALGDADLGAVGSSYDGRGPITVIDLASGSEHTIDAHGVVM